MAFTKVFKSLLLRSSFYGISIKLTLVYMSTMYFDVRKVFIGLRPRIFEITGTLFSKDIFKDILISSRLDDIQKCRNIFYCILLQHRTSVLEIFLMSLIPKHVFHLAMHIVGNAGKCVFGIFSSQSKMLLSRNVFLIY